MIFLQNITTLFNMVKIINLRRDKQQKRLIPCYDIDKFYLFLRRNHAQVLEDLMKKKGYEDLKKIAVFIEINFDK